MNIAISVLLMISVAQPKPISKIKIVEANFAYKADKKYSSMSIAGTFNNWNNRANMMQVASDGVSWSGTIQLKPGKYQYKFVGDFTDWIQDPNAKDQIDDQTGKGTFNSVIVVVPTDYGMPADPNDGKLTLSGLSHETDISGRNLDLGKLTIQMGIRPNDASKVTLAITGIGKKEMSVVSNDGITEKIKSSINWDGKKPISYSFYIQDGSKTWQFGPMGLSNVNTANVYKLDRNFKPFVVPDWVEHTVFYQIFPDRFENGNKQNDPKDVQKWTANPTYSNRFGGDIQGIRNKIGYLSQLGINGIYINPMMDAPANHRYDPVDFFKIDPELGSNREFVFLTKEMKQKGIKVVLDQIFDHVGTTFSPFADLLQFQEKSRYKDWFIVNSWPVVVKNKPPYEAWYGFESMPKLNMENPAVKEYLLSSVDYWMQSSELSGWRLDVANEVPSSFWKEFRKRVKGNNPNAWIVGEVWSDANEWLKGDQWDASMNYPFKFTVQDFLALDKTKPSEFMTALMGVYNLYPPQVSRNQLNLLCSHDTARFLNEARGRRSRQKLAAVVQFTWPGAPSVYYGEELGMAGGVDPDNRRGMQWELANNQNDMLKHYRWLSCLRTGSEVLATGEPQIGTCDDNNGIASFMRVGPSDIAVTAINKGSKPFSGMLQLPKRFAGKQIISANTGAIQKISPLGKLSVLLNQENSYIGLLNTESNRRLVRKAIVLRNQANFIQSK